jgi:hypothetical protein
MIVVTFQYRGYHCPADQGAASIDLVEYLEGLAMLSSANGRVNMIGRLKRTGQKEKPCRIVSCPFAPEKAPLTS